MTPEDMQKFVLKMVADIQRERMMLALWSRPSGELTDLPDWQTAKIDACIDSTELQFWGIKP